MSLKRGETFVTRKITRGIVESFMVWINVFFGNLNSVRDWGHAKDYVKMQWMMLQQDIPTILLFPVEGIDSKKVC